MQRPGEVSLRGETVLGLEVVDALLKEIAGGACSLAELKLSERRLACLTGPLCILSFSCGAQRA